MQKIYVKKNQEVLTSAKFIYNITVYKIWNKGAILLEEKHCANTQPLNLKEIPMVLRKENYLIQRYMELVSAPEEYLINKGYKLKKVCNKTLQLI